MGASCSSILQLQCCQADTDEDNRENQPLLADKERQAVATLVQLFENDTRVDFYEGEPLEALATMARSGVHHMQVSAATAFSEISEYDVRPVSPETLEPILYLLQSAYPDVQQGASVALGNLTRNIENKILLVRMGGLEPLVRLMLAPNTEAQGNSVGCITNLSTCDENKGAIAKSGALVPLARLARSGDLRVRRNATGALLNMTHSVEHRQLLVSVGAVPVLVELLESVDDEVLYYAATALSNIAVDDSGKSLLWNTEPTLVHALIHLAKAASPKVQSQAMLTLRNLASDSNYQVAIVAQGCLNAMPPLFQSPCTGLATSAAACLRNLSIHPNNEHPIICAGFLPDLVGLIPQADLPELQCHAIATIRNLAANNETDKTPLVDAGLFDAIKLALADPRTHEQVIGELTAVLSVCALNGQLCDRLVGNGLCELLLPLVHSKSQEMQHNACLTIGTLAGKGSDEVNMEFASIWHKPFGGMREYLATVLVSPEYTGTNVRSVAMWTVLALLSSECEELRRLLINDRRVVAAIEDIARTYVSTAASTCSVMSAPTSDALAHIGKDKTPDIGGYAGHLLDSEQATVDYDCADGESGRTSAIAQQVLALIHDY